MIEDILRTNIIDEELITKILAKNNLSIDQIVNCLNTISPLLINNDIIGEILSNDDAHLIRLAVLVKNLEHRQIKFTPAMTVEFTCAVKLYPGNLDNIIEIWGSLYQLNPELLKRNASRVVDLFIIHGTSKEFKSSLDPFCSKLCASNINLEQVKVTFDVLQACTYKLGDFASIADVIVALNEIDPMFLEEDLLALIDTIANEDNGKTAIRTYISAVHKFYNTLSECNFLTEVQTNRSLWKACIYKLTADDLERITNILKDLKTLDPDIKLEKKWVDVLMNTDELSLNLIYGALRNLVSLPKELHKELRKLIPSIFERTMDSLCIQTILCSLMQIKPKSAQLVIDCVEDYIKLGLDMKNIVNTVLTQDYFTYSEPAQGMQLIHAILKIPRCSVNQRAALLTFINELKLINPSVIRKQYIEETIATICGIIEAEPIDPKQILAKFKATNDDVERSVANHNELSQRLTKVLQDIGIHKLSTTYTLEQLAKCKQGLIDHCTAVAREILAEVPHKMSDSSTDNILEDKIKAIEDAAAKQEYSILQRNNLKQLVREFGNIDASNLYAVFDLEDLDTEKQHLLDRCDAIIARIPNDNEALHLRFSNIIRRKISYVKEQARLINELSISPGKLKNIKELCGKYLEHVDKVKKGKSPFNEDNLIKKANIVQSILEAKTLQDAQEQFSKPENYAILSKNRTPWSYLILKSIAALLLLPFALPYLLIRSYSRGSANFFKPDSAIFASELEDEFCPKTRIYG